MEPETIRGRWELRSCRAETARSKVWVAHDHELERDVALKEFILPESGPGGGEADLDRFHRETRAAALGHTNIVTVHDRFIEGRRPFIVMELMDRDLDQHLRGEGPLSTGAAVDILSQVLEALAFAHPDVLHNDLKLRNILLCLQPRAVVRPHAKVADFDAAAVLGFSGRLGRSVEGTLEFAAPERLLGREPDPRSDLFGVGLIAYMLTTGVHPLAHGLGTDDEVREAILYTPTPDPRSVVPGLPDWFARWVMLATAKDPDARFASADEMREALDLRLQAPTIEFSTIPQAEKTTPLIGLPLTEVEHRASTRVLPMQGRRSRPDGWAALFALLATVVTAVQALDRRYTPVMAAWFARNAHRAQERIEATMPVAPPPQQRPQPATAAQRTPPQPREPRPEAVERKHAKRRRLAVIAAAIASAAMLLPQVARDAAPSVASASERVRRPGAVFAGTVDAVRHGAEALDRSGERAAGRLRASSQEAADDIRRLALALGLAPAGSADPPAERRTVRETPPSRETTDPPSSAESWAGSDSTSPVPYAGAEPSTTTTPGVAATIRFATQSADVTLPSGWSKSSPSERVRSSSAVFKSPAGSGVMVQELGRNAEPDVRAIERKARQGLSGYTCDVRPDDEFLGHRSFEYRYEGYANGEKRHGVIVWMFPQGAERPIAFWGEAGEAETRPMLDLIDSYSPHG